MQCPGEVGPRASAAQAKLMDIIFLRQPREQTLKDPRESGGAKPVADDDERSSICGVAPAHKCLLSPVRSVHGIGDEAISGGWCLPWRLIAPDQHLSFRPQQERSGSWSQTFGLTTRLSAGGVSVL